MSKTKLKETDALNDAGGQMHALMAELYPICRSITGPGVRQTLEILKEHIPLRVREVPTGTKIYDWSVPEEWSIADAYIKNSKGEKVVDFRDSNLHVLNYSAPVKKKVPLAELKEHIFTAPEHPDWIPYRTSYYKRVWGFCMAHNRMLELLEDEYEVVIDSSFHEGHLAYGEYLIRGEEPDEVLISCHICHPSLCNDNLSGMVLSAFLAKQLSGMSLRYSYRFLFLPGTIGAIAWLCLNEAATARIRHGLVAACVGNSGGFTYKKSRQGNAEIDRAVANVLRTTGEHATIEFSPVGYDERQFCSPGFNLPVGCLMRTPHGRYPEYHTSADNLDFVEPESLAGSLSVYLSVVDVLENNRRYMNLNPMCEPQLGRRGIYRMTGGQHDKKAEELAMLWVLNLSDGKNDLLDISERSGLGFHPVRNAADTLVRQGLLSPCRE